MLRESLERRRLPAGVFGATGAGFAGAGLAAGLAGAWTMTGAGAEPPVNQLATTLDMIIGAIMPRTEQHMAQQHAQ